MHPRNRTPKIFANGRSIEHAMSSAERTVKQKQIVKRGRNVSSQMEEVNFLVKIEEKLTET